MIPNNFIELLSLMYEIVNYLQETGTMGIAAEHVSYLNTCTNTYYGTTSVTIHSMSDVTSSNHFIYPSNLHKITLDEHNVNINLSYSFSN